MFLTFIGGAGTVTGSKTLVDIEGHRVLVDCGLFQGASEDRARNWEQFPIEPADIDAVLLTHAHLDHCGYLPALVRDGFDGPVYCTAATAQLAAIVLRDSAHLQVEDAEWARRKGFSRHVNPRPLYDENDAEQAIQLFEAKPFHVEFELFPGVFAELEPSGHILGSAVLRLREAGERPRTIVFSGDLGRPSHPLLVEPHAPADADAVIIESTYGDRVHEDVSEGMEKLAATITRTIKRGGTVVIPAFAVDRTEVLLKALKDLEDQQRIPHTPVYVDSPMALATLSVYRNAIEAGEAEFRSEVLAAGAAILDLQDLHEAHTPEESMQLDRGGPKIIVSASGMAAGGRVVHHLKALLPDARNTVVLVGFQAIGTHGRALAEGAAQLKIHGQYVKVRAEVVEVPVFSVHGDSDELMNWLRSAGRIPPSVFVVHGEIGSSAIFAQRVREELDVCAVVPKPGERVRV